MNTYQCVVAKTGIVHAYATEDGNPVQQVFALAMENANGDLITVCLSIEDSMELRNQLTAFINNPALNQGED